MDHYKTCSMHGTRATIVSTGWGTHAHFVPNRGVMKN